MANNINDTIKYDNIVDNNDVIKDSFSDTIGDTKATDSFTDTVSDQTLSSSISLSSEKDIFFDHGIAIKEYSSIAEKIDVIIENNAKLNSLLNDINDYWGGSSKDNFVKNAQNYIETINKYAKYIDSKHIGLKNADTAYSKLDETFSAKEI